MLCFVKTDPGPRAPVAEIQDQNAPLPDVPGTVGQARAIGAEGWLARLPDHDVSLSAGELRDMNVKGLPIGVGIVDREVDLSGQGRSSDGQGPCGGCSGGCLAGGDR